MGKVGAGQVGAVLVFVEVQEKKLISDRVFHRSAGSPEPRERETFNSFHPPLSTPIINKFFLIHVLTISTPRDESGFIKNLSHFAFLRWNSWTVR